jgi:transposase
MKRYVVRLTEEEREELMEVVSRGRGTAYRMRHANILLLADADGPAWTDERIAEAFSAHSNTVRNLRQRFVEHGFEETLNRKKRLTPPCQPILDGRKEAELIALSCSEPPEGYKHWTLRLLADRLVELEIVETISYETVRKALKKAS